MQVLGPERMDAGILAACVGRAPITRPRANPPPATRTLITRPQWSRPGTGSEPGTPFLFIRGVRPNSPITITIVESSRPRRSRSSIRVHDGGVQDRQHAVHPLLEAGVEVPAAEGQGHEPDARLDQPAGQQGALAPLVPRVAVAEPRVLVLQVERPPGRWAEHHRERLLLEAVEALDPARRRPIARRAPANERQEAPASLEPARIDASRQREVRHLISRRSRDPRRP